MTKTDFNETKVLISGKFLSRHSITVNLWPSLRHRDKTFHDFDHYRSKDNDYGVVGILFAKEILLRKVGQFYI